MIEDLRQWFAKKGYISMHIKRKKLFVLNEFRSVHIEYDYLGNVEISVCRRKPKPYTILAVVKVSDSDEVQVGNLEDIE